MLLSLFLQIGLLAAPTMAGPVVCTTTFEAPPANENAGRPVEVTTCAPVETADELIERRLYTWPRIVGAQAPWSCFYARALQWT